MHDFSCFLSINLKTCYFLELKKKKTFPQKGPLANSSNDYIIQKRRIE